MGAVALWMGTGLVGTAWAGHACGEEGPGCPRWSEPGAVTLTVSPLRLTEAMLDLAVEVRGARTQSLSVTGALGLGAKAGQWEIGGQVREYILGNFDTGVMLGAQLTHESQPQAGKDRRGTTFGSFVGAKMTVMLLSVEARGGLGLAFQRQHVSVRPIVDLRMGVAY